MGAISFLNNYANLAIIGTGTVAYLEEYQYVNDGVAPYTNNDQLVFNSTTINGSPFLANYGILGGGGEVSDAECFTGAFVDPLSSIEFLGGDLGYDISTSNTNWNVFGDVWMDSSPSSTFHAFGPAPLHLSNLRITGNGAGDGTSGIRLFNEAHLVVDHSPQISNLALGVELDENSTITSPVSFASVTKHFQSGGSFYQTRAGALDFNITDRPIVDTYDPIQTDTFVIDPTQGRIHILNMTQNSKIALPSNVGADINYLITILACQDNVGNHTLTTAVGTVLSGLGTVSLGANSCSSQSFVYTFTLLPNVWYATGAMLTGL